MDDTSKMELSVKLTRAKRGSGESDWNIGSDWIGLGIRDKCWSRRSSRRNDAGLACEQIQRVESANAAQRRGAVEHPRSEEREECASGQLACAQCTQVGETEHVSQQEYSISTSTGHGPKLVLTSMSDAVCVDNSGKQQWGWS